MKSNITKKNTTLKNQPYKHIHILGASGSGTTTLAKALCESLPNQHIDSDDFYWAIKFSKANPRDVRLEKLQSELNKHSSWLLSGAVIDWGNPLIPIFDLVIFISVTNEIRLSRLKEREKLRYGAKILPSGSRYEEYQQFINWANQYETGDMDIRSRRQQKVWLRTLQCRIMEIDGDKAVEDNKNEILKAITISPE